jgi:hypothetical protein
MFRRALAKRRARRQSFDGQSFEDKAVAGAGAAARRGAGGAESRSGVASGRKKRKSFPLRKVVVEVMAILAALKAAHIEFGLS